MLVLVANTVTVDKGVVAADGNAEIEADAEPDGSGDDSDDTVAAMVRVALSSGVEDDPPSGEALGDALTDMEALPYSLSNPGVAEAEVADTAGELRLVLVLLALMLGLPLLHALPLRDVVT